jgi:hypothetical protein
MARRTAACARPSPAADGAGPGRWPRVLPPISRAAGAVRPPQAPSTPASTTAGAGSRPTARSPSATRSSRSSTATARCARWCRPRLTAEERAEKEARERQLRPQQRCRAGRRRAPRPQPDDALSRRGAHQRRARRRSTPCAWRCAPPRRVRELQAERKPLLTRPSSTKAAAAAQAQGRARRQRCRHGSAALASAQRRRPRLDRINRLYDIELDRLRRLWAGAPPGSLGPLAGIGGAAPAPR